MAIPYSEELAKELSEEQVIKWCDQMSAKNNDKLSFAIIDICRDKINEMQNDSIEDDEIISIVGHALPGHYCDKWSFAGLIWHTATDYLRGRADEYVDLNWTDLTEDIGHDYS